MQFPSHLRGGARGGALQQRVISLIVNDIQPHPPAPPLGQGEGSRAHKYIEMEWLRLNKGGKDQFISILGAKGVLSGEMDALHVVANE